MGASPFTRTNRRTQAGRARRRAPFDLFLASIATCAGIYVKGYCDARGIATEGLGIEMRVERDAEQRMVTRLALEIRLPEGFPEKHREGVVRAADLCAVKKHLLHPPAIEICAVSMAADDSRVRIPIGGRPRWIP